MYATAAAKTAQLKRTSSHRIRCRHHTGPNSSPNNHISDAMPHFGRRADVAAPCPSYPSLSADHGNPDMSAYMRRGDRATEGYKSCRLLSKASISICRPFVSCILIVPSYTHRTLSSRRRRWNRIDVQNCTHYNS